MTFWKKLTNDRQHDATATILVITSGSSIAITRVCLLVGSFVTLVVISQKLHVRFSWNMTQHYSASVTNFTVNFWQVKVKVQGQNRRTEILQIVIYYVCSGVVLSSPTKFVSRADIKGAATFQKLRVSIFSSCPYQRPTTAVKSV